MKLRQKTLLLMNGVIISLMLILYLSAQAIVLKSFTDLEQQDVRQQVARMLAALADEYVNLNGTTGDWAEWNDTYEFIAGNQPDYVQVNLVNTAFANLRVNLMLFIHASGQLVFGKAVDLEKHEEVPVPQGIRAHLTPGDLLLQHPDVASSLTGLVLFPEGPLLIAARPILTSEPAGPVRGTLVIGRYLDATEIRRLADITKLALTVMRVDASPLPPDFQHARAALSASAPVVIQALSGHSIAGYALIADLYGKPALIARVDLPRSIYQRGQASVRYVLFALLTISLALGLAMLWLVDSVVLSRVTQLNAQVSRIQTSDDLATRVAVTGQDELANLTETINGMLAALQHSQAETQRSAARLRSLSEATFEGILMHEHGQIVDVNQALLDMFGLQRAELINAPVLDVLTPALPFWDGQQIRMESEQPAEAEGRKKDGAAFPVEIQSKAMPYQGRTVMVTAFRDISDRKRAEDALRQSKETAERYLNVAAEIILSLDAQGQITLLNDSGYRLLGYDTGELLGQNWYDTCLPADIRRNVLGYREKLMNGDSAYQTTYENVVITKSGATRVILWHNTLLKDQGGRIVGTLSSGEDITDRKQAEEHLTRAYQQLKETQAQLVQAAKLASIGQLAAGVAHELNQPLMVIRSTAQLLRRSLEKGTLRVDHVQKQFEPIDRNTKRMMQIITHLRDFSRQSQTAFALQDVNQIIEGSFLMIGEQLRLHNIAVQKHLTPDLPNVRGDGNQLEQVVLNLLTNARDALDAAGDQRAHTIDIVTQVAGNGRAGVEILVTDSGGGIAAAHLSKIFDPFFTTKEVGKGTGLGLSISYGIIHDHQGEIVVADTGPAGTTFRVTLPVEQRAAPQ